MQKSNFFLLLQEKTLQGCSSEILELETGQKINYGELYDEVLVWSSIFSHLEQKIVSVILPNSINYLKAFFSINATRNIFNPIPYFINTQELDRIFAYIAPAIIVTDRDDIVARYGKDYSILDVRGHIVTTPETKDFSYNDNDLAALYYSSGTTGNPKGVIYSNKNMMSLISSIVRGFEFSKTVSHLAFLPFGHTASINYNILPALYCGAPLYISKGFEALRTSFFKVLSERQIGYTEVVPTVVLMLNKLGLSTDGLTFDNLTFIGCGSSTLHLTSQQEFMEKYNILLANLYGLSETGPSHIDNPLQDGWEPGSIGVPLDVNECQISDCGEILLRGDNVFVTYYKNEKLYKEVVHDGWFHTGDLGYEKGGKFYFSDRIKDLIIKGGVNIVPMEIEEVIYSLPEIHEAVVVSRDHALLGEKIVAVVKTKDFIETIDIKKKIKDICKQHLSNFKVPEEVYIWDSIPKTHSGKLMRKAVRERINNTDKN